MKFLLPPRNGMGLMLIFGHELATDQGVFSNKSAWAWYGYSG